MKRREARPGWRARLLITSASIVLSLALAELGTRAVRGSAYPFLNVFRRDARYGVLLAPGAETRTRSREGRVTDVAINAAGFRGPEWPSPAASGPVPGRVLLLGDSQMFGYGVDWDDATAAQLASLLSAGGARAEVLAAAVPSWGPTEYVRAALDLAPAYRPSRVIFVANLANDWFELGVPNARRSSERDGWLVRRVDEDREGEPTWFPGRSFVMGRSHLVLGLREIGAHAAGGQRPAAESAERLERDLPRLATHDGAHRSRMTAPLLAAQRACRDLGCSLVAVALPLDLQVHEGEWKKYRSRPRDLSKSRALLDDFVADAASLGIPAVSLLDALVAASPGAFLPDDYHLSPKGHRAVAEAIAPLLRDDAAASPRLSQEDR